MPLLIHTHIPRSSFLQEISQKCLSSYDFGTKGPGHMKGKEFSDDSVGGSQDNAECGIQRQQPGLEISSEEQGMGLVARPWSTLPDLNPRLAAGFNWLCDLGLSFSSLGWNKSISSAVSCED